MPSNGRWDLIRRLKVNPQDVTVRNTRQYLVCRCVEGKVVVHNTAALHSRIKPSVRLLQWAAWTTRSLREILKIKDSGLFSEWLLSTARKLLHSLTMLISNPFFCTLTHTCFYKNKQTGSTILKEWTTPDSRNTPSITNLEEEETVDAPGNDGNASMPEQVKRPNPWRKMTMNKKQFCIHKYIHISNFHLRKRDFCV